MPLTWKETRPGRWERPLSCLEKYNLLNRNIPKALDRDNWAKTAVAKLDFDPALGDPVAALKTAWKQVRYTYPEVAAFPYNGTYMYRVGYPEQVQLWVSATFVVEENATVDELFGHLPRNEQMMCYYLPKSGEVLVRSPHYRLDARGAVFILNHLIASLAHPEHVLIFGGCAANLSPSIDDALGIPYVYTPEIEAAAAKRLEALQPHNALLELTPSVKSPRPGASRRRFIRFSEGETAAVLRGAKRRAWDLSTALHASLIAAVAHLAAPSSSSEDDAALKSYMASFYCDLRALIPPASKTKTAPTTCTSVLTSEVLIPRSPSPSTSPFADIYAQLAPVHAAGYTPYLASTSCFHAHLAAALSPSGGATPCGDDAAAAHPRFSALGVVDDMLTKEVEGVVAVRDFWLGGEVLTARMMVHAWILEGRLVLSCCFNEGFWEGGFVEEFLERIKGLVMGEVAVEGEGVGAEGRD